MVQELVSASERQAAGLKVLGEESELRATEVEKLQLRAAA